MAKSKEEPATTEENQDPEEEAAAPDPDAPDTPLTPPTPVPTFQERHDVAREITSNQALALVQEHDPPLATLMVSRYGAYNSKLCRERNPKLFAKIRRP